MTGTAGSSPATTPGMVEEIAANPDVGLTFQGKAGMLGLRPFFLAIEGRASLIRDKAQFAEHWTKGLDLWFERGIDNAGAGADQGPGPAGRIIGTAPTKASCCSSAGRSSAAPPGQPITSTICTIDSTSPIAAPTRARP